MVPSLGINTGNGHRSACPVNKQQRQTLAVINGVHIDVKNARRLGNLPCLQTALLGTSRCITGRSGVRIFPSPPVLIRGERGDHAKGKVLLSFLQAPPLSPHQS